MAWVGLRTGSPTGYFRVQSGWGSSFDFGHYTAHEFKHLIIGHDSLVVYFSAAIALGACLLFVMTALDRQALPLLVYSAVLLVAALATPPTSRAARASCCPPSPSCCRRPGRWRAPARARPPPC